MAPHQVSAGARLLSFCLFIVGAAGISSGRAPLRASGNSHIARSFVRSLELKQTLRVCNAYPYTSSLDVYVGKTKLTERPLAYKSCGEYSPSLQVGDKVDFRVGDNNAGTFTIDDLPNSDAILLMVIYRHDTMSTAVSFESHVFASLASAQIAILDTYKGSAKSELRIQDTKKESKDDDKAPPKEIRSELLRFDSVVAVDPGEYEVFLMKEDDKPEAKPVAKSDLVAVPREAYVVMRCGVEAEEGTAYPQDLMVFPQSDKKALGAAARSFGSPLLALVLGAIFAALKA